MRKVRVNLFLNVSDKINDSDIEEYFEELEDDIQEHFLEIRFCENDGIYIDDVKVLKDNKQ